MKPRLYLIAGPNGAGKTTFLKEFIRSKNLKYINADEIAQKIALDKFSLLSIRAGKIALKRIRKFRNEKLNFAVETTLSGKMWKTMINGFKKDNYYITAFFIYLDTPEEAIRRIGVRINKSEHYVSEEVVYRRYLRSIKNFWHIHKSLVNKWYLLNNSKEAPFLVAYGRGKEYMVIDEESFKKFLFVAGRKEAR